MTAVEDWITNSAQLPNIVLMKILNCSIEFKKWDFVKRIINDFSRPDLLIELDTSAVDLINFDFDLALKLFKMTKQQNFPFLVATHKKESFEILIKYYKKLINLPTCAKILNTYVRDREYGLARFLLESKLQLCQYTVPSINELFEEKKGDDRNAIIKTLVAHGRKIKDNSLMANGLIKLAEQKEWDLLELILSDSCEKISFELQVTLINLFFHAQEYRRALAFLQQNTGFTLMYSDEIFCQFLQSYDERKSEQWMKKILIEIPSVGDKSIDFLKRNNELDLLNNLIKKYPKKFSDSPMKKINNLPLELNPNQFFESKNQPPTSIKHSFPSHREEHSPSLRHGEALVPFPPTGREGLGLGGV
jgi:hypothetical protein